MVDRSRYVRAARVAAAVMLRPPPLTAQQAGALRKLTDVAPVYPEEAIRGGVQGMVQLRITVGTDGRVSNARVIRSVPQLDAAALAAVRQWFYDASGLRWPLSIRVAVPFRAPQTDAAGPAAGFARDGAVGRDDWRVHRHVRVQPAADTVLARAISPGADGVPGSLGSADVARDARTLVAGEPRLCLAIADLGDAINDRNGSTAAACQRGDFRGNPILAVECLSLCGATGGTCDLTVTLTRFEKWGCANAAASGQPGFNCDYVLGYSLSGLMMQQVMSTIAPTAPG